MMDNLWINLWINLRYCREILIFIFAWPLFVAVVVKLWGQSRMADALAHGKFFTIHWQRTPEWVSQNQTQQDASGQNSSIDLLVFSPGLLSRHSLLPQLLNNSNRVCAGIAAHRISQRSPHLLFPRFVCFDKCFDCRSDSSRQLRPGSNNVGKIVVVARLRRITCA